MIISMKISIKLVSDKQDEVRRNIEATCHHHSNTYIHAHKYANVRIRDIRDRSKQLSHNENSDDNEMTSPPSS